MAEQSSDETRSAAVRRGARPFAGPAGVPAGTSTAARPPIFRPPTAGSRPMRRLLTPAPVVGHPSLGTPRATTPPALWPASSVPVPDSLTNQTTTKPAAAPVEHLGTSAEPIGYFAEEWRAGAGADVEATREGALRSPLDTSSLGSGIDAQQLWGDEIIALPESVLDAPSDSQWTDANQSVGLEPSGASSWLGVEDYAQHEMQAPDDRTECAAVPDTVATDVDINWGDVPSIPSADEVTGAEPASVEALGREIAIPAETASDGDDAVATTTDPDADDERHANIGVWLDPQSAESAAYAAVTVTVPDAVLAAEPAVLEHGMPEAAIPEEAVGLPSPSALPDALRAHEVRVSAALDRLAERIRGGEIDVSSVAPEATEAAVLASVLAALLRGSNTR